MATHSVTVVRVYVSEGKHLTAALMHFLQKEANVAGATVFRGLSGFSRDGELHTSSLLAFSLDLPEVVEFYDVPERVAAVLEQLQARMNLTHILSWPAQIHLPDGT